MKKESVYQNYPTQRNKVSYKHYFIHIYFTKMRVCNVDLDSDREYIDIPSPPRQRQYPSGKYPPLTTHISISIYFLILCTHVVQVPDNKFLQMHVSIKKDCFFNTLSKSCQEHYSD